MKRINIFFLIKYIIIIIVIPLFVIIFYKNILFLIDYYIHIYLYDDHLGQKILYFLNYHNNSWVLLL